MELDRIPVGVFDLDLRPARAGLDLVPERNVELPEGGDALLQVVDVDQDAVPTTGLLPSPVG
jgi:hypothetical protein